MLDLSRLGQYRENNRLEAKKAQGGLPHSIWETYSAFANTFGGYILLGVVENADKSFSSVPLPDPERLVADFWACINDRAIASVNILARKDVQILESGGNRIVVIAVPRANRHDKPVYIGLDPYSGTYRRSGEGDYRCTKEEVLAMMRDQTDTPRDARVLDTMTPDVLDVGTVQRYRQRLERLHPGYAGSSLSAADFLHQAGALAQDARGILRPTAAGLLMFGREAEIVREFPHYFLDYREYAKPAAQARRWRYRLASRSGDWSGNVCDFYFCVGQRLVQDMALPQHTAEAAFTDDAPLCRALQEALANALIHADYDNRGGLVVEKWPDLIRMTNPGALRMDAKQALEGGISDPRNACLIQLFHQIHASEQTGSGLPGIRSAWQQQHWTAPQITERFGPDQTTLLLSLQPEDAALPSPPAPIHPVAERRRAAILQYLTDTPQAGSAQIARAIGLGPGRTRQYLAALIAEGAVVADGAGRARKYRLKA